MDEVAASSKMYLSFKLWSDNVKWKSYIPRQMHSG